MLDRRCGSQCFLRMGNADVVQVQRLECRLDRNALKALKKLVEFRQRLLSRSLGGGKQSARVAEQVNDF